MFTEVLKTVAKFLVILVIFIIAFGNNNFTLDILDNIHHHVKGLGFHIMLSDQIREDECSANFALLNSTTATPNGPFKDTFGSLIKTYVMMIGEFEYEGRIILVLEEIF